MSRFSRRFIQIAVISLFIIIGFSSSQGMGSSTPQSNKKGYIDVELSYSVSYPDILFSQERKADLFTTQNTQLVKENQFTTVEGEVIYSVGIFENFENLSLHDWIDKHNPTQYGPPIETTLNGI